MSFGNPGLDCCFSVRLLRKKKTVVKFLEYFSNHQALEVEDFL